MCIRDRHVDAFKSKVQTHCQELSILEAISILGTLYFLRINVTLHRIFNNVIEVISMNTLKIFLPVLKSYLSSVSKKTWHVLMNSTGYTSADSNGKICILKGTIKLLSYRH